LLRIAAFWILSAGCESSPTLEFDEVSSVRLPPDFRISGAHTSAALAVAWAIDPPAALLIDSARYIRVGGDRLTRPIAAAVIGDGSAIEFVDAYRSSVITYARSGQLLSEQQFSVGFQPFVATRTDRGWVMAGMLRADSLRIVLVENGASVRNLYTTTADTSLRHLAGFLDADTTQFVYAEMAPPFRLHIGRFDGAHRVVTPEIALPSVTGIGVSRSDSTFWVGLRAFMVGELFVQTLADVRSTHRVIRMVDGSGALVRNLPLDVAMGFTAADRSAQRLLAVRRADEQELVTYRWRWRETK
jgi:hypothetical protein